MDNKYGARLKSLFHDIRVNANRTEWMSHEALKRRVPAVFEKVAEMKASLRRRFGQP
jgi:hypothetical protein